MGKNPVGFGMNIPDHFSESLETVFRDPGSGIFLIRDPGWKNSDLGAGGLNIRDPQHWSKAE
jgi:hypothetical protein